MGAFGTDMIDSIRSQLYPFTLKHLMYFILITVITTYITEYFLRFRLLKWIYIGTLTVLVINLYKDGDKIGLADNIFKLATV